MKAIVFYHHGSPDVLQLREVEKPGLTKDHDVLIKVHAAAVNALDSHLTRGILKFSWMEKLIKPKQKIPGVDFSGIVVAIGNKVTHFSLGDTVFGNGKGAFAEYICTSENLLVKKHESVSFEEAATIPVAALTALQGLRDYGKIKPGQHVLVNGAGGGVGTFTVQIAKALGAKVTATCSAGNMNMVRSIGAEHVIDYAQKDITKSATKYDVIMAVNGYHPIGVYKKILVPSGIFVMMGAAKSHMLTAFFQAMLFGPLMSIMGNQKFRLFIARIQPKDLQIIQDMVISGKVKPVIDKRFPLHEVPDAIRYLEEWHSKGKIVIMVEQP